MKTAVKDCLKKIKETLHVYISKDAVDKIIDGSVLLIKSDNERKKTVFADSNDPLSQLPATKVAGLSRTGQD